MVDKKRLFSLLFILIIGIFLVFSFSFVSAFSFSDWFNSLFNGPSLSPAPYSGLPDNFQPSVGYYHEFGGGRITLWDAQGNVYYSNVGDTITFNSVSRSVLASQGLPSNFIPVSGDYHNLSNTGGAIFIFDTDGNGYKTKNGNGGVWNEYNSTDKADDGLPANYKPKTVMYSKSGRWDLSVWNNGGKIYRRDNIPGDFVDVTAQINADYPVLTTNKEPKVALAYKYTGKNYILFFYNDNGLKVFRFDNDANSLFEITNPTGLPSSIPKVGYFDAIRKKLVIWYGTSAYESDDGITFQQITIGGGGESCTPDNNICSGMSCGSFQNGTCGLVSCGSCQTGYTCTSGQCIQNQQCSQDSQCTGGTTGVLICASTGNTILNRTSVPKCISGSCGFQQINVTVQTCSAGYTCSNAACVAATSCVDGDSGSSGNGYYLRGQVNYTVATTLTSYIDYCKNTTAVSEFSCTGTSLINTNLTCPDGCSNGACLGTPVETCFDSDTDEFTVKGYVNYTLDGEFSQDYDLCDEDDNDLLIEGLCDGDSVDYVEVSCSEEFGNNYGCRLGICARLSSTGGTGGTGGTSCTQSRCFGQYYIECVGGQELSPAQVPGECGYSGGGGDDCFDDFDCGSGEFCNNQGFCEREIQSACTYDDDCGSSEVCKNGLCQSKGSNPGAIYYFLITLIVLVIVITLVVIYFFMKKKASESSRGKGGSNSGNQQNRPSGPPGRPGFMPPRGPPQMNRPNPNLPQQNRPPQGINRPGPLGR